MSKVVRISEKTYQRMQKIAKPFDDTPDTVIEKLLDFYESDKLGKRKEQTRSENTDTLILDVVDPIDLTHTEVLDGHFNNIKVKSWRELVSVVHKFALDELGSFNEVRKISISNIVEGEKEESGFKPIAGANISIQGANANTSWNSAFKIAKRLKKPIKMEFRWRYKSSATHPNRLGILEWKPK